MWVYVLYMSSKNMRSIIALIYSEVIYPLLFFSFYQDIDYYYWFKIMHLERGFVVRNLG